MYKLGREKGELVRERDRGEREIENVEKGEGREDTETSREIERE